MPKKGIETAGNGSVLMMPPYITEAVLSKIINRGADNETASKVAKTLAGVIENTFGEFDTFLSVDGHLLPPSHSSLRGIDEKLCAQLQKGRKEIRMTQWLVGLAQGEPFLLADQGHTAGFSRLDSSLQTRRTVVFAPTVGTIPGEQSPFDLVTSAVSSRGGTVVGLAGLAIGPGFENEYKVVTPLGPRFHTTASPTATALQPEHTVLARTA